MSRVFRGKFVALLKDFLQAKGIAFSDELRHEIYKKDWVVYAKRRFYLHIFFAERVSQDSSLWNFILSKQKESPRIANKNGCCGTEKGTVIYINPDFKAKACPCCSKGEMHVIMSFGANAPPFHDMINELKSNKLGKYISLTC